ncbi:MAG: hypothetical protein IKG70_04050 [Lachnospiraceae bacterium]|nr:hypothetical protein [Lachnospiraceae bacterium]
MAEIFNEDQFKSARKGGYDKEDVDQQFFEIKEAAAEEKNRLSEQLEMKDSQLEELRKIVKKQQTEIDTMKQDIAEKYQSYIDNYDTIGRIIYDSNVQAKKVVDEANQEHDQIIAQAQEKAGQIIEEARLNATADALREKQSLEAQIERCKKDYAIISDKISQLLRKVDDMQKEFNTTVHSINSIADSEDFSTMNSFDFEDFTEELPELPADLEKTGEITAE